MRTLLLCVLGCAPLWAQPQYIGRGKTTAVCIDWDGDGYGDGPAAKGPYTDLVIDGSDSSKVTSASHSFTVADLGDLIVITGGTGFAPATYWVSGVTGGAAQLARKDSTVVGTVGSTGGTWHVDGCTGPDADDDDATVQTTAQGITKYGTFLAFVQHLGYNPTRIWYFDSSAGDDANSATCHPAAGSFDPATTPRCKNFWGGDEVIQGTGLTFQAGDMFLFRGGTTDAPKVAAQARFYAKMACTSGAPCIFLAYPGEVFVLDNQNNAASDGITIAGLGSHDLCSGDPCTKSYADYASTRIETKYVTFDGFWITDGYPGRFQGQGISCIGCDYITMKHLNVFHVARGSYFNDNFANTLLTRSVLHQENASHCVYWGGGWSVPKNVGVTDSLLYNCGLPHFQFNGRAEDFYFRRNIVWGDVGSGTSLVTLMKGGGSIAGYPAEISNNVLFNGCNEAMTIDNYPDQVDQGYYQWPIGLNIVNNTMVYAEKCSASGNPQGASALIYMGMEGLNKIAGGPPWDYSGQPITGTIRNNLFVNNGTTSGVQPYLEVHTRSSTYGCYGTGTTGCGNVTDRVNAPDDVEFLNFGKRDPVAQTALFTIDHNYHYSTNFATNSSTAIVRAHNNCYADQTDTHGDCASLINGGTLPTGYTGLTYSDNYKTAAQLTALNAANVSNVVTNADPLLARVNYSDRLSPPMAFNFTPLAGSPLFGAGTATGAPSTDIMGVTRSNPPSIGAYELTGAAPSGNGGTRYGGKMTRGGR